MSPTADQSKNAKAEKMKDKIRTAYMEYRLLKGEFPGSVFAFCKELKVKEAEFYALQ